MVHLTPPTCHLRPIHQPPSIDQRPPTNAVPPIPKPRIGYCRAGIRRKPKVAPPAPKPIQTLIPPKPTPAPGTAQPLPEPETQSQESTMPQHYVPAALLPIAQPTPVNIIPPIEPRVEHRPLQPLSNTIGKIYQIWTWTEKLNLRKIHPIRRI